MYDVIFTFRSMTAAQQGHYACKRRNIPAPLIRTPYPLTENGCGFAVQIPQDALDQVLLIFKVERIEYERVYQKQGNRFQEVRV